MALKMPEFKPPTLKSFLFYFNLITANVVIAWIHFAVCILIILEFLYFLVFNTSKELKVENIDIKVDPEEHDEFTDTFDIISRLIILVVVVFVAFITFWFIKGIQSYDPSKMKPYLFFTGTFVILCLCAAIVTLNFITLMIGVVELYFFICAYSLYFNLLSDPSIQQDVVYNNPGAYGYTQALESDGHVNGAVNYQTHQQQPQQTDGYYNQEGYYEDDRHEQQQPQQPYYNGQQ
ncbi:unnamed protein product [Chironomus riparius]|uniref:Uncharacterized protein n=1 Tax=Chironomus riparius TaxID=315576 RepID=A0A9N9S562_9DIPT|nr:unnamed protein product [Chironomus riparius]